MGAWRCENACFPQNTIFRKIGGKTSRIFSPKLSFLDIWGENLTEFPPKLIYPEISGEKYERFPPKTQIFENLGESTVTREQNFFAKKQPRQQQAEGRSYRGR